jgi:hypothetical protein
MRNATVSALGILLVLAGLTSCTGDEGPPLSPMPVPSGTPVYASEEEALAAAEEVYGRYLEVSNAVGQGGWVDVDALREVERGEALEQELEAIAGYRDADLTQVGTTTFDSLSLQQFTAAQAGEVLISFYLCLDVTGVDIVDRDGSSVVTSSRPDRQPVEVDIDDVDGTLKISRSEAWSGASFC